MDNVISKRNWNNSRSSCCPGHGCSTGPSNILSSTESGYSVTVSIGDHPFGNEYSYIDIDTENGWKDSIRLATAGDPSYTFHVPPGYGDSVRVCAKSAILASWNCETYYAGEDISVTLDVD